MSGFSKSAVLKAMKDCGLPRETQGKMVEMFKMLDGTGLFSRLSWKGMHKLAVWYVKNLRYDHVFKMQTAINMFNRCLDIETGKAADSRLEKAMKKREKTNSLGVRVQA